MTDPRAPEAAARQLGDNKPRLDQLCHGQAGQRSAEERDAERAVHLPGAKLKLSHGSYGFSVSETVRKESVFESSAKLFTLKLEISGTVKSPTTIAGTVSVRGGPCALKRAIAYTAKLDNKASVAPGD